VAIERTEGVVDGGVAARDGSTSRFRILRGIACRTTTGLRLLRECRERCSSDREPLVRAVRERLLHAAACAIRPPVVPAAGRIARLDAHRPATARTVLAAWLQRLSRPFSALLARGGVR
jgi:hypothetical protein